MGDDGLVDGGLVVSVLLVLVLGEVVVVVEVLAVAAVGVGPFDLRKNGEKTDVLIFLRRGEIAAADKWNKEVPVTFKLDIFFFCLRTFIFHCHL